MKTTLKPLAIAAMSIAMMFVGAANAQVPYIPGPITGPRIFPNAMPRQAIADGCGGLGSTIVKWVEDSAANNSRRRFGSAEEARRTVEQDVESRYTQAKQNLIRQYGGGPHEPQYVPPNLVVPGRKFGYAMDSLDGHTFSKCFPKLAKLMADTETRVMAEAKAEAERRAEEARKQAEFRAEEERKQAEWRKAETERQAAEAERQRQQQAAEAEQRRQQQAAEAEQRRQQQAAEAERQRQEAAKHEAAAREKAERDAEIRKASKFATPLDAARSVYVRFELVPDERAYDRDPTYTGYSLDCEYPKGAPAKCNYGKILALKYYEKTFSIESARRNFLERTRDVVPLILKNFPEADGVIVRAYGDFVNLRGNDSIDMSFSIRIDRKNSDSTNWSNVKLDNIMKFADVYWQHQSVTDKLGKPPKKEEATKPYYDSRGNVVGTATFDDFLEIAIKRGSRVSFSTPEDEAERFALNFISTQANPAAGFAGIVFGKENCGSVLHPMLNTALEYFRKEQPVQLANEVQKLRLSASFTREPFCNIARATIEDVTRTFDNLLFMPAT
jgi:flagellar biosynthesis GTPase FlhF